jgi:hypothetical protein
MCSSTSPTQTLDAARKPHLYKCAGGAIMQDARVTQVDLGGVCNMPGHSICSGLFSAADMASRSSLFSDDDKLILRSAEELTLKPHVHGDLFVESNAESGR